MNLLAKRIDRIANMVVAKLMKARTDETGQWLDNMDVMEEIPGIVKRSGIADAILEAVQGSLAKTRMYLDNLKEDASRGDAASMAIIENIARGADDFEWFVRSKSRRTTEAIEKTVSKSVESAFDRVFADTPLDTHDLEDFVQDMVLAIYREIRPEFETYATTRVQDAIKSTLGGISQAKGIDTGFLNPNGFLKYLWQSVHWAAFKAANELKNQYSRMKTDFSSDDGDEDGDGIVDIPGNGYDALNAVLDKYGDRAVEAFAAYLQEEGKKVLGDGAAYGLWALFLDKAYYGNGTFSRSAFTPTTDVIQALIDMAQYDDGVAKDLTYKKGPNRGQLMTDVSAVGTYARHVWLPQMEQKVTTIVSNAAKRLEKLFPELEGLFEQEGLTKATQRLLAMGHK